MYLIKRHLLSLAFFACLAILPFTFDKGLSADQIGSSPDISTFLAKSKGGGGHHHGGGKHHHGESGHHHRHHHHHGSKWGYGKNWNYYPSYYYGGYSYPYYYNSSYYYPYYYSYPYYYNSSYPYYYYYYSD